MPLGNTIWIDKLDRLEIDGDGVRICLASDDTCVKLRMSRHQLRRFIESGRFALAEAEAIDRNKLVAMGCKAGHG